MLAARNRMTAIEKELKIEARAETLGTDSTNPTKPEIAGALGGFLQLSESRILVEWTYK
jgi:hypothetical protein